jgi:hypothetical protein
MENNIKESTQEPVTDWNANENNFKTSLTDIIGLEGAVENNAYDGSINGTEFMPVNMHTPYYERVITQTVSVPWLAQDMEKTYMNRTKEFNEPPVETYKELKLSNLSGQQYENVENFGENTSNLTFKILCFIFLVMLVIYLVKQIK